MQDLTQLNSDNLSALNLGSQNALESVSAEQAMPEPPPGYRPGYTAPIHQDFQDSPIYRIGEVLSAMATPPGEIPVALKLRQAQAETTLKMSQDKLAWDNFYRQNQVVKETIKTHNRNAITQGLGMLPQFKGIVHSITDPTERTQTANHLGRILDNYAPGLGKVMQIMDKDPAHILGYDMLLSHPIYGPQFQPLADTMSYEQQVQDPGIKHLVENLGRDTIPLIISRFTTEEQKELAKGHMPQQRFEELYNKAVVDESFGPVKPRNVAFAKTVLNTTYGEEIMEGFGVQTYAMTKRRNAKDKPDDVIGADKNARYLKNKEILAFAEANPGVIDPARLKAAREQNAIALGDMQKQTNPGENVNNSVVQRWHIKTNHKYNSMDDALSLPDGPERTQALRAFDDARKEQDAAPAFAQMGARMATPGDTSNYISADELLKTGRAVGVKGNIPEGELRSNKKYLKATPEQKKQISELNVSQESSWQIFEEADKAFTGSSAAEAAADAVLRAEDGLLNSPFKAIAKAKYPALAIYVARREATLGKFARSISGEFGVLTDQDVVRVRNLFPVGGDTKQIRAAKKKSLDALINLNRKFAIEVLSGELLPEDVVALKNSDTYRSAVNGILGSAEGLSTSQNIVPQSTIPSDSKPKDTRTRAERLADEMQKEGR